VVVLVLLCGAVIGMGIYFFIVPAFDEMERLDGEIGGIRDRIEEAKDLIDRSFFVDENYERKLERAQSANARFYDELTITEAITTVQQLLEARGHRDAQGLTVSEIAGAPLSITLFAGGRNINYDLRRLASVVDEIIADSTADPGEVIKEEWLEYLVEIAMLILSEDIDEDMTDEQIEAKINAKAAEMSDSSAFTLREIIAVLKGERMSEGARAMILDIMRARLATETVTIGGINANFSLDLTYSQFLDFLDYINRHEKAMIVRTATLYQDISAAGSEARSYDFSLTLLVMKPMEALPDTGRNPMLPPEPDEDDPQKEEVDPDENGNGD
jgi:hypothetical protein